MGFHNLHERPNVANGIEFNRGTIKGWLGYEIMLIIENIGGWFGVGCIITFIFVFVIGTHYAIYNREMLGFSRPHQRRSTSIPAASSSAQKSSSKMKKTNAMMKKKL